MLQYNHSTNLLALINNLKQAMLFDPVSKTKQDYAQFSANWLNINTCTSEALDNWGRILNFPRGIQKTDYTKIFGLLNTDQPITV